MAKRYVVEKENIQIQGTELTVTGREVHHINVMRYKVGDSIYINNYLVTIKDISDKSLIADIVEEAEPKGEPTVNIDLYMGFLKSDKMDYVVQKVVELGVKKIVPIITKNTVVKLDQKDRLKKEDRFKKIISEAIGQCGRTDEVTVGKICDILETTKNINSYDLVLVCHEQEKLDLKGVIVKSKVNDIKNIAVYVGPEGGLDSKEVEELVKYKNAYSVCFGERILRAETAANYILSILDYEFLG